MDDPASEEFGQLQAYYKQRLMFKQKNIRYHLVCAMSLAQMKEDQLRESTAFTKML